MIRIAIVGDIGSGKSHIAKLFNYPVFNADLEVAKIYKTNKLCFKDLKKKLPKYFLSLPIKKEEIISAIDDSEKNLKKITNIVHPEVRKKLNIFLKNNKKKDIIILDIPLLLENKLNEKDDVIIFIQSKKSEIIKRLKKRDNFNLSLLNKFKKIQLSLSYKKEKSHFIIKNNFTNKSAKTNIAEIIKKIL
ncbi:dephospho-CoA kinase [Candidatus Pelagibacter sp. Uisw_090]|uniref:dephospho-CoA kinase n=1 Tax=Candidatus Pelagibacter sp. Uisw_090 TaxID=3230993 RepID=UPI0039E8AB09